MLKDWFCEALSLQAGEELLLPAASKAEATRLRNRLLKLREEYPDQADAESVSIRVTLVKRRFFVALRREPLSPTVAFKRATDGSIVRVTLSSRERLRRTAIQDGLTAEQIEEILGRAEDECSSLKENEDVKKEET